MTDADDKTYKVKKGSNGDMVDKVTFPPNVEFCFQTKVYERIDEDGLRRTTDTSAMS